MNDSVGGRITDRVRSGQVWKDGRHAGARIATNSRQAGVRIAKGVRSGRLFGADQASTWRAVDALFEEHLIESDEALEAAAASSQTGGLPTISVSPTEGKLLHLLVRASGARSVLEVGTLAGYSTIWLARALPEDGRLITLEVDPHHADVARQNLERAGVSSRVEVRVGPALETLDTLTKEDRPAFDFVFIDADKRNNPDYFSSAVALSRPGAVIVVDNVVREGRVADPAATDPDVVGIRTMLEAVGQDGRVDATAIQTVGSRGYDGFLLAVVGEDGQAHPM